MDGYLATQNIRLISFIYLYSLKAFCVLPKPHMFSRHPQQSIRCTFLQTRGIVAFKLFWTYFPNSGLRSMTLAPCIYYTCIYMNCEKVKQLYFKLTLEFTHPGTNFVAGINSLSLKDREILKARKLSIFRKLQLDMLRCIRFKEKPCSKRVS